MMPKMRRAFTPVTFILLSIGLLSCGTIGLLPGGLADFLVTPTSMAARSPSWSHAEIAKPTYTPTPTVIPIFTPIPTDPPTVAPTPTETAPLLVMTIVDDASSSIAGSSPANGLNTPQASQPSAGGKYIRVSISEQHLYAYQDGQLVNSFVASTGMGNSTRVGTFSVLDKIPNAYGATWNIWMPDWLGIYQSGSLENGIHALPILPGGSRLWAGYLGTPISYGCVVLGVDEANWLYNWAEVGTPVEIRW